MNGLNQSLSKFVACAILALGLVSCSSGGSDGGGTTSPPASATVTGTVSGTRIVAMNDNDKILAQDDTAGSAPNPQGQFPFSLANLPVGQNLRLFFVSNGTVFPLYLGSTNVFTFNSAGPINLGFVTMDTGTGRATPEFPPANVTPQPENPNTPPGLIPGVPTIAITSPSDGATVPVGPVTVAFVVQNHTIGKPGISHLDFYLDGDQTPYHFYGGTGINEDKGVLYNGVHTHFVHWKSASSFDIFGLPSTTHTVRLVLVNQNHNELPNPEATKPLNFTVEQPPTGDLELQSVLSGLSLPAGMSLAPDGRVFFNEVRTGNIRIINQQWELVPTEFCHIEIASSGGEEGLLGLTLDPDFANNKFVYVYYTTPTNPLRNRVVRYTDSNGSCTQPNTILDDLPAGTIHNGGIMRFGPDGKLYVVIGDTGDSANAQNPTSLAGKVLRVNKEDGSAPSDNPFFLNANANAKKVFSLGHRNSYGFTFHGHTGHLWQTENGLNDNDEINRIVRGGNYGWPTWGGIVNQPGFIDPILTYTPNIAPTGIIAIPEDSTTYPAAYRNNLLFVDFLSGKIRRIVLSGANLTELGTSSTAYNGGGFLLSIMLGADGFVYVSGANEIFKVVPVQ